MQFELQRIDYSSPETSGRMGGVQAGWPKWSMRLSLTAMRFADADRLRAWARRLRGQQRRFLGGDSWRPYPRAHAGGFRNMLRAGGGAFDGSATDWSQAIDPHGDAQLTLEGLASGLILGPGDYVGFKWASGDAVPGTFDRYAMVCANSDARADAAGALIVEVDPPVPTIVPPHAVAYLNEPVCLMKLMDGTQMPANERGWAESGGVIAAIQVLEP